jgi:predicted 3-demethylubiquinone-9 3-methyltransferase (glyoxalase superfamily)
MNRHRRPHTGRKIAGQIEHLEFPQRSEYHEPGCLEGSINPSGVLKHLVEFTVIGIPCVALNGAPGVKHNEAFSFQIATDDQAETDRFWKAIVRNGGEEGRCGWCKDRWGVSWQITPRALIAALSDRDPAAAKRSFEAMMAMGKIDIAAIEAARRGR